LSLSGATADPASSRTIIEDLGIGVLANIITAFLTLTIALLWFVFVGRRKLLRFFGIQKTKQLRIYTGHIKQEGIPLGVVGFEEISEAKNLERLFRSTVPGQSGLFRFLQLTDIDVEVLPARQNDATVSLGQSVISLGLRTSNHASLLIERELKCPVHFDDAKRAIVGPNSLELVPYSSGTKAVVVRLCHDDKHYFYLAGFTEPATACAARFLLRNWRSMHKRYSPGKSFYYLVEMKPDSINTVISLAEHELHFRVDSMNRKNGE